MELFDILGTNGNVIGRASRKECHSKSFLLHGVVHVLVFRSDGRIILQKRSETKDIQPGKWDTSVGGHIASGESTEEALERETLEELGISKVKYTKLYSYIMTSEIEKELVTSYSCVWDGPLLAQEDEIDELRAFSAEEIEERLGTGCFTPNFEDEWRYYLEWENKEIKAS